MKRYLPLAIIGLILGVSIYFDLHHLISLEVLKENRDELTTWVRQNFFVACLIFMFIYTVSVAASIPGAAFLTITGGFLFGAVIGSVLVVFSATLGATCIFLAVQTALAEALAKKADGWVKKMEDEFQKNAFNYLLSIRLIPIFPFWIVNIVPALLGMKLRSYVLATAIGIIPGSVVYVLVGNGLGAVIDQGEKPNLGIILQIEVLAPLPGLAVLSLLPVLYKNIKKRGKA